MTSQQTPLRHRTKKTQNYGSLDACVQIEDDEHNADEHNPTKKQKQKLNEVKSMSDFSQWMKTDSSHKLSVIFFFISLIIPFIIGVYYFVIGEKETSYIIAGIYGFVIAVYGMNHFRLLFYLKDQVDSYVEQNYRFKGERDEMSYEVNRVKEAVTELKKTRHQLRIGNRRISNLNQKFHELELRFQKVTEKNIKGISEIARRANKVKAKHYNLSLQQQKIMLGKIFDRLERKGHTQELTKKEYKKFVKMLPKVYQERFSRLGGFKALLRICGSDRDYIGRKDFNIILGVYARMHVENTDITFKIMDILTQSAQKQPVYTRKMQIIQEMQCGGFYKTAKDIFEAKDDSESD